MSRDTNGPSGREVQRVLKRLDVAGEDEGFAEFAEAAADLEGEDSHGTVMLNNASALQTITGGGTADGAGQSRTQVRSSEGPAQHSGAASPTRNIAAMGKKASERPATGKAGHQDSRHEGAEAGKIAGGPAEQRQARRNA